MPKSKAVKLNSDQYKLLVRFTESKIYPHEISRMSPIKREAFDDLADMELVIVGKEEEPVPIGVTPAGIASIEAYGTPGERRLIKEMETVMSTVENILHLEDHEYDCLYLIKNYRTKYLHKLEMDVVQDLKLRGFIEENENEMSITKLGAKAMNEYEANEEDDDDDDDDDNDEDRDDRDEDEEPQSNWMDYVGFVHQNLRFLSDKQLLELKSLMLKQLEDNQFKQEQMVAVLEEKETEILKKAGFNLIEEKKD